MCQSVAKIIPLQIQLQSIMYNNKPKRSAKNTSKTALEQPASPPHNRPYTQKKQPTHPPTHPSIHPSIPSSIHPTMASVPSIHPTATASKRVKSSTVGGSTKPAPVTTCSPMRIWSFTWETFDWLA